MHRADCRYWWQRREDQCTCRTGILETHCQACGTTDLESVGFPATRASEGYSLCCNEIVVDSCGDGICYHEEAAS